MKGVIGYNKKTQSLYLTDSAMTKSRVEPKRKVLQDGMSLANEKQLLAMTARVRC